jgi:hypothetical protein
MGPNNEKREKNILETKANEVHEHFFKRSCQREPKLKTKQPTVLKDNRTRKKEKKYNVQ